VFSNGCDGIPAGIPIILGKTVSLSRGYDGNCKNNFLVSLKNPLGFPEETKR